MKKLGILAVLLTMSFIVLGQPGCGGAHDPFNQESVCDRSVKEGYHYSYRFNVNGNEYVLSYDTYLTNEKWKKPPTPDNDSIRIERSLRLYRLDDPMKMIWSPASEVVFTDYREGNFTTGINYDFYFSSVDENDYKTYVKSLPKGDVEMRILKLCDTGYTSNENNKNNNYYLIVQFHPKNDGTYEIIKLTKTK